MFHHEQALTQGEAFDWTAFIAHPGQFIDQQSLPAILQDNISTPATAAGATYKALAEFLERCRSHELPIAERIRFCGGRIQWTDDTTVKAESNEPPTTAKRAKSKKPPGGQSHHAGASSKMKPPAGSVKAANVAVPHDASDSESEDQEHVSLPSSGGSGEDLDETQLEKPSNASRRSERISKPPPPLPPPPPPSSPLKATLVKLPNRSWFTLAHDMFMLGGKSTLPLKPDVARTVKEVRSRSYYKCVSGRISPQHCS